MEVVKPKSTDLTQDQLSVLSYFNVLTKEEQGAMLHLLEHSAAHSVQKRVESERKPEGISYERHLYGEVITAPKGIIQRFGVGVGMAFPGEGGNGNTELRTKDPRGFPAVVIGPYANGDYSLVINFPGREKPAERKVCEFALGVKYEVSHYADRYSGKADALVAAGLVRREHLPGAPGMRKVKVRIYADGTLPTCHPNANDPRRNEVGSKEVNRLSDTLFEIYIRLSQEEAQRRKEEYKAEVAKHAAKLRTVPLPPPLKLGSIPAIQGTLNVYELKVARQSRLR